MSRGNDNSVLLEEIVRDRFNLMELWPESLHTQELKKLSQMNEKIIPVDIRPMLIPFSWELVESNKKLGTTTLIQYIQLLDDFFNKKSYLYNKYIENIIENISSNKKSSTISPLIHFNELKLLYDEFKTTYSFYMNKTILYIFNNMIDILNHINNMTSMIMEWYIILLVHNNSKNSIIHIGLAHSNKILDLLVEVYKFKIINTMGLNKMKDINMMGLSNIDTNSSCIMIPQDIRKKYNKKYGFYF